VGEMSSTSSQIKGSFSNMTWSYRYISLWVTPGTITVYEQDCNG